MIESPIKAFSWFLGVPSVGYQRVRGVEGGGRGGLTEVHYSLVVFALGDERGGDDVADLVDFRDGEYSSRQSEDRRHYIVKSRPSQSMVR